MTEFIILATLISVIVVALLVWSSIKQQGVRRNNDARAQCYQVHEQTLLELANDHKAGLIDEATYREARYEAENRLVADIRNIDERPVMNPAYRWIIPVSFAVPLVAAGLYLLVGNLAGSDPAANFVRTGNVGQFVNAVEQLEEKVRQNPEDLRSQLMLARSYRAMGRYEESVIAFGRAWPLIKDDATEISIFAGVLALYRGSFEGKPDELIEQALALDANDHDALTLAGGSAFQKGQYAEAIRHWKKLQALVGKGSEEHQWVAEQIEEAQWRLDNPGKERSPQRDPHQGMSAEVDPQLPMGQAPVL
ncbi:c-type cytochrome biogenesis protein CcmI [Achromobacter sp. F4_2707]|uniref:c-type cytochrome biogenesis protein CcmI n=1 Tax=Achromobacter sp. F4_2707 TaxID=3114286 RepID=UPI0039C5E41A